MAEVKILVEGYTTADTAESGEERTSPTITLVKDKDYDGITLLVKTDKGIVAICGDVFWKENYPENDPYASDQNKLEESRKKVLEMANYVIPGHAGMFKVKK